MLSISAPISTTKPMPSAEPPPLPFGRCRWCLTIDVSQTRRRRRQQPAEKYSLPSGTLLLAQQDGGLTLCWTQTPLPIESADHQVTLCFDESVQVIPSGANLKSERVLSVLEPHFQRTRYPMNEECKPCAGSSHRHVTVECVPEPLKPLDSSFIASFTELPATLLSMWLIQVQEGNDRKTAESSPLAQACIKRLLVGYHFVFLENEITTRISILFQGSTVCFQIASILPGPNRSSRTAEVSLLRVIRYGDCHCYTKKARCHDHRNLLYSS